jgi:hypothetical protein
MFLLHMIAAFGKADMIERFFAMSPAFPAVLDTVADVA